MLSPRVAVAFACLCGAAAQAADWPAPAELPRRPELPNPLETFAGQPIEDAEQWAAVRRPELRELFQHYMYGRQPEAPPEIRGTTLFSDSAAFDGAGTLREVELAFGPPDWPKIYLLIAAPNGPHPAPCFVGINFGGNHMRADDPRVRLPTAWMPDRYPGVVNHRATDAGRGKQGEGWDVWPLAEAVGRGYAVATFYCGDVQPDRPDEVEGMRATVDAAARSAGDATGHLMWWAWGLHRAVDYLAADAAIDPQRIAVVGHSRLGKAALLAGALDERIALTVANQAGCGGSGPSRHDDPEAETVGRISDKYGYWFCPNFAEFGADPARLPFDQHALVALYAPRPVLFTAAADDAWANPSGQFAVLRAATPVYRLLGVAGLDAPALPQPGDPLVASRLGYWIRPGAHAFTPADWQSYMDFADRWLRR